MAPDNFILKNVNSWASDLNRPVLKGETNMTNTIKMPDIVQIKNMMRYQVKKDYL